MVFYNTIIVVIINLKFERRKLSWLRVIQVKAKAEEIVEMEEAGSINPGKMEETGSIDQGTTKTELINPGIIVEIRNIDRERMMEIESIDPGIVVEAETINQEIIVETETIGQETIVETETINPETIVETETINPETIVEAETISPETIVGLEVIEEIMKPTIGAIAVVTNHMAMLAVRTRIAITNIQEKTGEADHLHQRAR